MRTACRRRRRGAVDSPADTARRCEYISVLLRTRTRRRSAVVAWVGVRASRAAALDHEAGNHAAEGWRRRRSAWGELLEPATGLRRDFGQLDADVPRSFTPITATGCGPASSTAACSRWRPLGLGSQRSAASARASQAQRPGDAAGGRRARETRCMRPPGGVVRQRRRSCQARARGIWFDASRRSDQRCKKTAARPRPRARAARAGALQPVDLGRRETRSARGRPRCARPAWHRGALGCVRAQHAVRIAAQLDEGARARLELFPVDLAQRFDHLASDRGDADLVPVRDE